MPKTFALAIVLLLLFPSSTWAAPTPGLTEGAEPGFPISTPEAEGVELAGLQNLTDWVQSSGAPVLSILISRHGKLVYELYTSSLTRAESHYLMSVTKSFLSALVGAAIDRGLISSADQSIASSLPRSWFASDADYSRYQGLTLKDVMGMSALDNPDPPRDHSPAALKRQSEFLASPNHTIFALTAPLLSNYGTGFQYNDENPTLVSGALAVATGQAPFDFANDALFGPLGFQNHEWMHEDSAGIDMGGYGLRVRPIDLQKFGNLYLNQGTWAGKTILSKAWIQQSFTPWNTSGNQALKPNYGWFWWQYANPRNWVVRMANGWKGQRILIVPDQSLVVTVTGIVEDGTENSVIAKIANDFVFPAVLPEAAPADPAKEKQLAKLMEQVRGGLMRAESDTQWRMIPTVAPKQLRLPFNPGPLSLRTRPVDKQKRGIAGHAE